MRDLWVWRYSLETAGPLNALTGRRVYEGALVREGAGFGCLHCWPELGDPTLEDCLSDLAGRRQLALVRRTADCLAADGKARLEGRSLFEGLRVPRSHATLTVLTRAGLESAVEQGFDRIKVKAGRKVRMELAEVAEVARFFPGLSWRIDFNGTGRAAELSAIFRNWTPGERRVIDFLEDPVVYGRSDWKELERETGLTLANDRDVEKDRGDSGVLVVKPAVNTMQVGPRVVVTSYLDHPLGQVFAAWEAARAGVTEVCGLQTHGAFEPNDFSEVLGTVAPDFRIPEGAGLGFDDLLAKLPWTRLQV